jgi:hypothetical protein
VFETQKISAQGRDIPRAVEESLFDNLFDFDEFKNNVLQYAKKSLYIKDIIESLLEPPPPSTSNASRPYYKEDKIVEDIFSIAASGDIVINAKGTWIGRRAEDASDDSALNYIKHRATDQINAMKDYQLALPGATGGAPIGTATQQDDTPLFPQSNTTANTSPASGMQPAFSPDGQTSGGTAVQSFPPPVGVIQAPPVRVKIPRSKSTAPSSGINLIGQFELWDLSSERTINKTTLEFDGLNVSQIKQILQRIPSAYQAGLSILYDDDAGESGGIGAQG